MIQFVVRATASLLGVSAMLVIVGLFDALLGWDIFSPSVEKILYGVFFSCITLACAGIALTFVLGILEVVALLRFSQAGASSPPRRGTAWFSKAAGGAVLAMAAFLVALGLLDGRVQAHRQTVFRGLAGEQAARFAPKVTPYLSRSVGAGAVEPRLEQAMDTLRHLDLFHGVELYLADPQDRDALWQYARGYPSHASQFERRYAARAYEHAVLDALHGDRRRLETFNTRPKLALLHELRDESGVLAVLLLRGNELENFRAYSE